MFCYSRNAVKLGKGQIIIKKLGSGPLKSRMIQHSDHMTVSKILLYFKETQNGKYKNASWVWFMQKDNTEV